MDAFSQSLPQPPELLNVLNGESQDFAVKAQKSCPVSQAVTLIIFGLFWSGMLSFFLVGILGPFIQGQPIHYKSNGVMVTVPPGHLGPMIVPLIIVGVFSLIGIAMLAGGFNMLFA
ncbi:MAG: hypothetical protein KGJ11_09840, partial [Candidatus Omnitrophica bacterium]|nr:hypothetical protein [Candidatus Omnitrophota bacterium]